MTSNMTPAMLSEIEALEAAGWAPSRFVKRNCNFATSTFHYPMIISLARDRDYSSVTNARKRIEKTPKYLNANEDAKKQLLAEATSATIMTRANEEKNYRSVAQALGHIEVNGVFAFELKAGRTNGFGMGACMLCGMGHGVRACGHYGEAETYKRGARTLHAKREPKEHSGFLVNFGATGVYANNGFIGGLDGGASAGHEFGGGACEELHGKGKEDHHNWNIDPRLHRTGLD